MVKGYSQFAFYKALTQESKTQIPWIRLWRLKAPPKAAFFFFLWIASLGKILTTENLRKRRVIIVNWCCMYREGGESVNHLLLHCETARVLWNEVFSRLDLS